MKLSDLKIGEGIILPDGRLVRRAMNGNLEIDADTTQPATPRRAAHLRAKRKH